MMAATLADGETIIENAAREPEVVDLANFLIAMGAKIQGAGTDKIVIQGVEKLRATSYEVQPDRIEAGTYLVAGAITSGLVRAKNVDPEHLDAVTAKLREAGAKVGIGPNWIEVDMKGKRPKSARRAHGAVPGVSHGHAGAVRRDEYHRRRRVGTIVETIFENRFMHMLEMRRLGAEIRLEGNTAIIKGVPKLTGGSRHGDRFTRLGQPRARGSSWPKAGRRSSASITSIAATKHSKKSWRRSARRYDACLTRKARDKWGQERSGCGFVLDLKACGPSERTSRFGPGNGECLPAPFVIQVANRLFMGDSRVPCVTQCRSAATH